MNLLNKEEYKRYLMGCVLTSLSKNINLQHGELQERPKSIVNVAEQIVDEALSRTQNHTLEKLAEKLGNNTQK